MVKGRTIWPPPVRRPARPWEILDGTFHGQEVHVLILGNNYLILYTSVSFVEWILWIYVKITIEILFEIWILSMLLILPESYSQDMWKRILEKLDLWYVAFVIFCLKTTHNFFRNPKVLIWEVITSSSQMDTTQTWYCWS